MLIKWSVVGRRGKGEDEAWRAGCAHAPIFLYFLFSPEFVFIIFSSAGKLLLLLPLLSRPLSFVCNLLVGELPASVCLSLFILFVFSLPLPFVFVIFSLYFVATQLCTISANATAADVDVDADCFATADASPLPAIQ